MLTSLRASVWIIGLRRLAKTVRLECAQCQRLAAKVCNQIRPPLPQSRVSRTTPFSVVGIDYAGPLHSLDTPDKVLYVCLFICTVIRAMHLVLTHNLRIFFYCSVGLPPDVACPLLFIWIMLELSKDQYSL